MKELPSDKLNVRNDIAYEVNSQSPFTGIAVRHYDKGEIMEKTCYKDGLQDGESIYFYLTGQWKLKMNFITIMVSYVRLIFIELLLFLGEVAEMNMTNQEPRYFEDL